MSEQAGWDAKAAAELWDLENDHAWCEWTDCPNCPAAMASMAAMWHILWREDRQSAVECRVCGYYEHPEEPDRPGETLSREEALRRIRGMSFAGGFTEGDLDGVQLLQD